jgi:hypothetical protein
MTTAAATWAAADAHVHAIARAAGNLPIYWGTGYPVPRPHVVASTLDAWSGEGVGYFVRVYPQGERPGAPCDYHTVYVGWGPEHC